MAFLDWVQQILGGGQAGEETAAAGRNAAMQPGVNQWMQGIGEDLRQAVPQSTYDPGRSLAQNTLDPRGLEAAFNVAMGIGGVSGLGIKAYHASPYDFDRFSLDNLRGGTGGLAQGHGLYFAGHEPVSLDYKNGFMERGGSWEGPTPGGPLQAASDAADAAFKASGDTAWQRLQQRLDTPNPRSIAENVHEGLKIGDDLAHYRRFVKESDWDPEKKAMYLAAIDAAAPYKWKPGPAHMYEVDINTDPARLLDYDKPLSQQSQYVQEALAPDRLGLKPIGPVGERGYYGYTDTGNRLIGRAQTQSLPETVFSPGELGMNIAKGSGSWEPEVAAERLRNAGIPGIKYLDQFSRAKGEGTSNYVMFDPALITILRKYGILPPAAGAGLLGAADQQ